MSISIFPFNFPFPFPSCQSHNFSHLTLVCVRMLITTVLGVFVFLVASTSAVQGWAKDFAGAKVDEFLQANTKNLGAISQEARDIYRQLRASDETLVQGVDSFYTGHLEELADSKSTKRELKDTGFIRELFEAWVAEKCKKFDALGLNLPKDTVELNVSKLGSLVQLKSAFVQKLNQICRENEIKSGAEYDSFISCSPYALKKEYLPSMVVFGSIFGFSVGAMILLSLRKKFGGGVKGGRNSLGVSKSTKK